MLHNEVASSSGVFYEARLSPYEAALRAMKRTFGAWSKAWWLHSAIFLAKKMAEREGFEPSTIRLMKLHLKEGFIQSFERNFLKF